MQETKLRWNVINYIRAICDALVNSNLEPEFTNLYQGTMLDLEEYFGTNEAQTWIMCFAVYQHFNYGSSSSFHEFAEFLDTNVLNIVNMHEEFMALSKRGFIDYNETNSSFQINDNAIKCILENVKIPCICAKKLSYTDFVCHIGHLFDHRCYVEKSCDDMVQEILEYEEKNKELPLVTRASKVLVDYRIRFFFYALCSDFLQGATASLNFYISNLYDELESLAIAKQILDEKHILFKDGLIEFVDKGNLRSTTIKLSKKGQKLFLDEDYCLFEEKIDERNLLLPENIRTKKLFYSSKNEKQINSLKESLSQTKFKQIQKRLADNGLPTGFAVLLYGAPGCGKTETVFQLAKKTGRGIVKVDISNIKDKYVGESEKNIKRVFTNYKQLCEKAVRSKTRIPILLFNECDAIFSKRFDIEDQPSKTSAQTSNAIQNIILEEMENLTGIMIATTNLTDNLDPAFERRFLFKIRFDYPDERAKCAIWKSKLKWLSDDNAAKLASTYNLSGGEIDNVVRKAVMQEITSGSRPDYKALVELCGTEKFNQPEEIEVSRWVL